MWVDVNERLPEQDGVYFVKRRLHQKGCYHQEYYLSYCRFRVGEGWFKRYEPDFPIVSVEEWEDSAFYNS